MRRWVLAGVAIATLSCGKKERPHPRVAELTTPLHVTVRAVDYPDRSGCEAVSGPLERVKCWVSPNRKGFTYVEAGADADAPVSSKGELSLDMLLIGGRDNTQQLIERPLKKVRLEFDPQSAHRAVVDADDVGFVLTFSGTQLVEQDLLWEEPTSAPKFPDGTLDWARIRPTEDPRLDITGLSREAIAAMAQSEFGRENLEDAVQRWVEEERPLDAEAFNAVFELASPETREAVVSTLLANLRSGSAEPIGWFDRHPALKTAAFDAALWDSLTMLTGEELTHALHSLRGVTAPALLTRSCSLLEAEFFLSDDEWSYRDHESILGALALLAHAKARCPWVVPLLERSLCDEALTCRYLSMPELGGLADPDASPAPPRPMTPLCTAADKQAVLDRYFTAPAGADVSPREADWGPLLLVAAEAQGPLPADVSRRLARRAYTWVRTKAKEPGEAFGCETWLSSDDDPEDWACRVPASLTTSTREECRLDIDDTRRVLKLTPLGAPLVDEDR